VRNYIKAYQDVFKSGFLTANTISKHVERHIKLDKMLPNLASFFYVLEVPLGKYHFMGRHQTNVTGFKCEEFIARGVPMFLNRLHPDDAPILLNEIYPLFLQIVADLSEPQRKEAQLQYNYRFRRKDGNYLNLMEQLYILEFDEDGAPALLLGNVIELDSMDPLPVRFACRLINEFGCPEIIYSKTFSFGLDLIETLTGRELEILCKLAQGNSSREIGEMLCISRHTVDTHRRHLLRKMECKSVVDLVRVAFNNGLT